ncbi:MAG: amino acid-binding protein [Fibrobacterota bacterium]
MKITQISVFLENRQGRLYEVAKKLGDASINIRALNIAETDDFGVLRIIVDRPADALAALKAAGFVASTTDIVAVEVPDHPGGLARVLKTVSETAMNVEYMYGFFEKKSEQAILVFRFDDPDAALAALKGAGITIVNETDVKDL